MRLYKKGHRLKVIRLPKDDKQLIARAIEHDRAAQRELFERFAPKMLGVCRRYISDLHHAEDVMLTGFFRVFHHLEQFRGDGSFEGWIRRVFINSSIEHFRKKSLQLSKVSDKEENTIEDTDISALDNLAEKDIINLIQQLSPGYRTVFNLYVVEGYSHREIGEKLGISEGTSKSQLARARSILQKKVAQYLSDTNKSYTR